MDADRSYPERLIRRLTPSEWSTFAEIHGDAIVAHLRPMLEGDGLVKLTTAELGARALVHKDAASQALSDLAAKRVFVEETFRSCGCCSEFLSEEDAGQELCPNCAEALKDCGVIQALVYVRSAPLGRDVRWVLILHGMNTSGVWQEELSWLIATSYRRMVPVFIYKYGRVRAGVFLRWRQRQLAADLELKVSKLRETYGAELAVAPDVVAHSFGSWLIGRVLLNNPDFSVGRLILAGSVLRPDFDWSRLVERGQVEAILNHVAANDKWVPLAHFVIPDAGPSGTRGFTSTGVIHRAEDLFGHSSFFDNRFLRGNYERVWGPALRRPRARLSELSEGAPKQSWRPLPALLREALRLIVLGIVGGLILLLLVVIIAGTWAVSMWI